MHIAAVVRTFALRLIMFGLAAVVATAPAAPPDLVLTFALGKSSLNTAERERLTSFYHDFSLQSSVAVRVIGHTDQSGDEEMNLELSRKRAQTVAHALLRLGLSPLQLQVDWEGEFRPVAPSETHAPDERNRRVVVSTSH